MSHSASTELAETAASLAFTRLVHFTPARSLNHILADRQLRSSKDLADAAPGQFSPTDTKRFDRHPGHVCCSFEYPNNYYLDQASKKATHVNYPDWVILTLAKNLVLTPGALFCGCNAAKDSGRYLRKGARALADCWANPSIPQRYHRSASHLVTTPTDLQSEVLIPGPIPLLEVTGIIVASAEAAEELTYILQLLHLDPEQLPWKVAPVLFDKAALALAIHTGNIPQETPWVSSQGDPW